MTDPFQNSLEILEARIAPAAIPLGVRVISAIVDTPILLHAGDLLNTGTTVQGGTFLLYVEKGDALIFTTDFNNNGVVDYNEITGISAGNGLRLTSFVDIHGDIVTNLRQNFTLTDSDNNSGNDDPFLRGDGRVILNNTIEAIEMRSLTIADVVDGNGDGFVDESDVGLHLALSSYSIHGSIYAGRGFGVSGDPTSGLIIDDVGRILQQNDFTVLGFDFFIDFKSTVGSIKVGTATNGEYFNFGSSLRKDTKGYLTTFVPPNGQPGADIVNVRAAVANSEFNIDAVIAGDGGRGARGGNVENVSLASDTAGGYTIRAGNGGSGPNGGDGGSIINFSDAGSYTSQIVIRSGDGGAGSSGTGGNAGTASFGVMNVNGGLGVTLGSGGDGFVSGGSGASLTNGRFLTPTGTSAFGTEVIGSVHRPGMIGRSDILDFDHDGFGDVVYSSVNPHQLVVEFGDGAGNFRRGGQIPGELDAFGQFGRIHLAGVGGAGVSGLGKAGTITAGDFNGDGFDDIAVASHEDGNFTGLVVFLSKTEDVNHDGIFTPDEDVNGNGVLDFTGFESPIRSTLPSLYRGDTGTLFPFRRTANAIGDIEAGDFNGDGIVDIAVASTYYLQLTGLAVQVVVFMTGDAAGVDANGSPTGLGTGTFYADVGTKATPASAANPLAPFLIIGASNTDVFDSVIEATALTTGGPDVIVGRSIDLGSNVFIIDGNNVTVIGPASASSTLPFIDTDRGLNGISIENNPTIRDIVIHDIDGDGIADLTAITASPNNFLVAALGDGMTFPTALIGGSVDNPATPLPMDERNNTGAFLEALVDPDSDSVVIRNFTLDGTDFNPVVILFQDHRTGTIGFSLATAPAGVNGDDQLTSAGSFNPGGSAMDITFPMGLGSATETVSIDDVDAPNIVHSPGIFYPVSDHYVALASGSGGVALVGKGGNAGNIGLSLDRQIVIDPNTGGVVQDLVGSISIGLSSSGEDSGFFSLTAGAGGNGFSGGGKGGSINGTSARFDGGSQVSGGTITAGNGGLAAAGRGGDGGDLINNSIAGGEEFNGGIGGNGTVGGDGGSIIGNGRAGAFDSRDLTIMLTAGAGGGGVKTGGKGGDVIGFRGAFDLFFVGAAGGLLSYTAGAGGAAVLGKGGDGGSVIDASPLLGRNNLAGNITLIAGDGGNGRKGGVGGDVRDFVNGPSESDNPGVLSFIAGSGGSGTFGRGGNGGNVLNIDTPSVGKPNPLSIDPTNIYAFNRFLAGDGGASPGGKGGNGGRIQNLNVSNSDNPVAMAAGEGGDGLYKGGTGGNLQDIRVNLGAGSFAKALFIAGEGGSAAAFIPNPNDGTPGQSDKAFGGRIGKAGNGGSIVNLTQAGSIGARIDLIAGNGGDTVNYGTVIDNRIRVGKGGSITGVRLDGNVGNIDPLVPLTSYQDVFAGESVADFVTRALRVPADPFTFPPVVIGGEVVDDSAGMVGAVVGSAGRIKAVFNADGETRSLPANGGKNGKLLDLSARNIASAVAGSVERLAVIQAVGNVFSLGIIGKNTDDSIDPAPYRNPDGSANIQPVPDGRLVDGALVFKKLTRTNTIPLPAGQKIFDLA